MRHFCSLLVRISLTLAILGVISLQSPSVYAQAISDPAASSAQSGFIWNGTNWQANNLKPGVWPVGAKKRNAPAHSASGATQTSAVACAQALQEITTQQAWLTANPDAANYADTYNEVMAKRAHYEATCNTVQQVTDPLCPANQVRICTPGSANPTCSCRSTTSTCPAGQDNVRGVCVDQIMTCTGGNVMTAGGACAIACPAGQALVPGTSNCAVQDALPCPGNEVFSNGACACPVGLTLVPGTLGSCAHLDALPPICPAGQVMVSGHCAVQDPPPPPICTGSEVLVNGQCVVQDPPVCTGNTVLVGGHCVVQDPLPCTGNAVLVGGHCVIQDPPPPPVCTGNTVLLNGHCVVRDPLCPANATYVNGKCTVKGPIEILCPEGETVINGQCAVKGPIEILCPEGEIVVNGQCVVQAPPPTPTPACLSNQVPVNGVCVPIASNCQSSGAVLPPGVVLTDGGCPMPDKAIAIPAPITSNTE